MSTRDTSPRGVAVSLSWIMVLERNASGVDQRAREAYPALRAASAPHFSDSVASRRTMHVIFVAASELAT